jgi:hypothetical protein
MTKQKQRLLKAKIAAALYHEEGRVPTTAEIEKWTKLTFPYRDFSEYTCGLADGTP